MHDAPAAAVAAGAVPPDEAAVWLADVLMPRRPGALLALPTIVTAGRKPASSNR